MNPIKIVAMFLLIHVSLATSDYKNRHNQFIHQTHNDAMMFDCAATCAAGVGCVTAPLVGMHQAIVLGCSVQAAILGCGGVGTCLLATSLCCGPLCKNFCSREYADKKSMQRDCKDCAQSACCGLAVGSGAALCASSVCILMCDVISEEMR